jgi:hypothetical protein
MRADIKYGRNWGDAQHSWQELRDGPAPITATTTPIVFEEVALAAAMEVVSEDKLVPAESIPFMITGAMREQLHTLGVPDQKIFEMTPQQAHAQLELSSTPSPKEIAMPAPQTNGGAYHGSSADQEYPCGEREVGRPETEFIYRDIRGAPYLKVCKRRTPDGKKYFPQYHLEAGRWVLNKPVGRAIPYRLPELMAAPGTKVWICEGEKDAETLAALGLVATCNPEGAGKWTSDLNKWFDGFSAAVVLEDNDEAGHRHAPMVAANLYGVVPDVRIVRFRELPEHGDVTNWFEAGGTLPTLLARAEQADKFDMMTAEPFVFPDESGIPAWKFLYGKHLLCEEVSGTAAQGGTGKSSLSIVEGAGDDEWQGAAGAGRAPAAAGGSDQSRGHPQHDGETHRRGDEVLSADAGGYR